MAKHSRNCAHNVNYHVVFCPKKRKPVLVGDIAVHCKAIIEEACAKVNSKVEAIEVMPDHVHVFISAVPKVSPHQLVKQMKGLTSRILREHFPQLLTMSSLWSSSYYVGTVGHVSDSVVKLYIANQKSK